MYRSRHNIHVFGWERVIVRLIAKLRLEGIALVALFGLPVPGISMQIAQQMRLVLPCQDRNPTQRLAKTVPLLLWPARTDRSPELCSSRLQTLNSWEHSLLS